MSARTMLRCVASAWLGLGLILILHPFPSTRFHPPACKATQWPPKQVLHRGALVAYVAKGPAYQLEAARLRE